MIAKVQPFSDYDVPSINFNTKPIYSLPKPTLEMELYPSIRVFDYFNPKPAVTPTPILPKIVTSVLAPVLPKVITQPVAIKPAVVNIPMAGLPPKKTITFTVKDKDATIREANIAVDGVPTAKTDINGKVTLPNIPISAAIKVTYVGYDDYDSTASTIPSVVILKEGVQMLNELVIENNYKKPKSNAWLWWLAGAVGAFGIYKYSNKGTKVVKAKI
jgi:hypothetical protein